MKSMGLWIKKLLSKTKPKQVRFIADALLISGVLIALIAPLIQNEIISIVFAVICSLFIITAIVILLAFWKCPSCERMLPLKGVSGMKYCPYCSNSIDKYLFGEHE